MLPRGLSLTQMPGLRGEERTQGQAWGAGFGVRPAWPWHLSAAGAKACLTSSPWGSLTEENLLPLTPRQLSGESPGLEKA